MLEGATSAKKVVLQKYFNTQSVTTMGLQCKQLEKVVETVCSTCPPFWSTTHLRRWSCWSGAHCHSASLIENQRMETSVAVCRGSKWRTHWTQVSLTVCTVKPAWVNATSARVPVAPRRSVRVRTPLRGSDNVRSTG